MLSLWHNCEQLDWKLAEPDMRVKRLFGNMHVLCLYSRPTSCVSSWILWHNCEYESLIWCNQMRLDIMKHLQGYFYGDPYKDLVWCFHVLPTFFCRRVWWSHSLFIDTNIIKTHIERCIRASIYLFIYLYFTFFFICVLYL
jgi:hypothetical protein